MRGWSNEAKVTAMLAFLALIVAILAFGRDLFDWTLTPSKPTETPVLPTSTLIATPKPSNAPVPGPTPANPTAGAVWKWSDSSEMVYVPEGTFWMGSDEGDEIAFSDEKPLHKVYLDAFWIDRTEVTNAHYAAFLNEQGNQREGGGSWLNLEDYDCLIEQVDGEYRPKDGYADHPVVEVTWYGARAYCTWVGRRLPTEAEWEKAARGDDRQIYPWGYDFDCTKGNFDDETENDDYVVPGGLNCDGYVRAAPVGSFPAGASPYGALDMAGNVWEWVADWYDGDYYADSPERNPQGPNSGEQRVVRGGSWAYDQGFIRAAHRSIDEPPNSSAAIGFRCACSVSEP